MLLALLLAATPSAPVELQVVSAGLLAPMTRTPVGSMRDVPISAVRWLSPTVLSARHESATIQLEALLDLSRDGTAVEALATRATTLSGTGAWTAVLKEQARVPLLGRLADGLRIGFLPDQLTPLAMATVPDEERPVPAAAGPAERCVVRALHARAERSAPRWDLPSSTATVHRGPSKGGWASAWAEGSAVIIHGFVHEDDVDCHAGAGGGLGLSGVGTGASDGVVNARAATLPAGTKLFASPKELTPFATLKTATRGLLLDDGTWRLDHVKSGAGEVSLRGVFVARETPLTLEPARSHGVGSVVSRPSDWPRLRR
ncbi:MAG: hypothetical protein JNJ54_21040 [Myxococcaceae bacterium]|nr:hypothetical protein [Myxococcaceae bacterium]